MKLPAPQTDGAVSVEQAIGQRRTVRAYGSQALDLVQLAQLLWAAHGVTEKGGFKRAAPSAGALYPMDVYVVVGRAMVAQVDAGIFHYGPRHHSLTLVTEGDLRDAVARACLSQTWTARAPVQLVITAEYRRAAVKYGDRAVRYATIEAGHIGQNLFLQAESLGLKAGIVGAFDDRRLIEAIGVPAEHHPLLVMPVGYPG